MSEKKFFVNVDLQGNEVVKLKADTLDITTNAASSNTKRIVYWDGEYYYSNGTKWVLMGNNSIVYLFGHNSNEIQNLTTYYIGNQILLPPSIVSENSKQLIVQKTGLITDVSINITIGGTLGSSETATFKIYNIDSENESTITSSAVYNEDTINNYTLNSPLEVTKGDKIEIQWETPDWETIPTLVKQTFNVLLSY